MLQDSGFFCGGGFIGFNDGGGLVCSVLFWFGFEFSLSHYFTSLI